VIEQWQKALVLAPHTDDGEFGCGGTMARLLGGGGAGPLVALPLAWLAVSGLFGKGPRSPGA